MAYDADDKTLKQNLWIMADGRDENERLALPCEGFLINSGINSRKAFVCSFYDTRPDHLFAVFPRSKDQYAAFCASETSKLVFTLTLAGPNNSWIYALTIPEIRIQMPEVEACP